MNRREALAALMALPAAATITRAEVGPTDVIVIEVPDSISQECAQQLRQTVAGVWPGRKVAILANGIKLKIVRSE